MWSSSQEPRRSKLQCACSRGKMNVDRGYTPTVEESVLPKMIKPIDASDSGQPSLSPPHHSPLSAASPTRFPLPPLTLKPLARSVSNPVITASSNAHRMSLVPRVPLRKGKWTPEEEMYAHYIIDNFNKGLISLTRGRWGKWKSTNEIPFFVAFHLSFPPSSIYLMSCSVCVSGSALASTRGMDESTEGSCPPPRMPSPSPLVTVRLNASFLLFQAPPSAPTSRSD